jgi:RNA polymerase sigma factor (sigma-70 family)
VEGTRKPSRQRTRLIALRKTDASLSRRAAGGDERAFAEIFERYGDELYRYVRAILGHPEDAQDALQNTMARLLRSLPGEQRTIALRPWLYRIARNEAVNLIRARSDSVEFAEHLAPAEPAADIRAEHREQVRTLVRDLAALPELQRSALVLHELNGLSHDEISEALQRSPRASRQAVYEARLALQELEEGRQMDCDQVRIAISDGDRRVLRGRLIRSHLRDCDGCSGFALAMGERQDQLRLLAPPLPAATAASLLSSVLGGGAAGGIFGSGAAGLTGGAAALKSVALVSAGLAIGVGGAELAGVDVKVPGIGGKAEQEAVRAQEVQEDSSSGVAQSSAGDASSRPSPNADRSRPQDKQRRSAGTERDRSKKSQTPQAEGGQAASAGSQGVANAPPHSNAGGASAVAGGGQPATPPGQAIASGGPPPHSSASGSPSAPAAGPPPHSNAGGNGNGNSQGKP